jgi:hypothetical protein
LLDVGGTLSFSAKLYSADPALDPSAVLVNPLTASLTISLDGTTIATPVITVPPAVTGTFAFNYPTTLPGRYVGRWLFGFVGGETAAHVETFNVQSADPGYLISLAMAKKHLNITSTDDDDEIRDWLAGITRVVEFYTGACIPKTVVEYQKPGRVIRLDQRPVLSVASITPYLTSGISYGPSQFKVTEDGTIRLLSGNSFVGWGDLEVTYTVGRRPTPANIIQAVKIILGHLWETQKGPAGSPVSGGDDSQFIPGFGFAVPNRAVEMLKPDDEGPAVG